MIGADVNTSRDKARDVFWRYHEVENRGHPDYIRWARRLEDFYLGGGRMWLPEHRRELEGDGRPCREVNTILPTVNAAAGFQIANRVDVSFLPKGGAADETSARVMGKVMKHVLDTAAFRYRETEVFLDGLIQQRGYFDVRMDYERNIQGDVKIITLDPMDVLPDPDAKSYDPDDWADNRITRWLTLLEIEGIYGKAAADAVKENAAIYEDRNWGTDWTDREGFGNVPPSYCVNRGWYEDAGKFRRYRVIDQQAHEYRNSLVAMYPDGDVRVVEGLPREHLAWLIDHGVHVLKRRVRRVHWQVAAPEVCFIDQLSPYEHFTTVPFFPYFRRGRTIGMVDNMVSPSEMLNKFVSQYEHVVNGSANSGWQGEAESLENMTDAEFTEGGAQTGLVLLRKQGTQAFTKIEPNQIPTGIEKIIDFTHDHINIVSGVDPEGMNVDVSQLSGVALDRIEYNQQKKLAVVNDNLARTRRMVVDRAVGCIQRYMGAQRVVRITEQDSYGVERRVPLALNVQQDDGTVLNDLTVGDYDIAINERPASATFNTAEFDQIERMRKMEPPIPIPDAVVVRASNLADKSEIADAMQQASGQTNPLKDAQAQLALANAQLAKAKATGEGVKAMFAAVQTASTIVISPAAASLADALMRSAGFVDQDAAPIIPDAPPGTQPEPMAVPNTMQNTHPLDPANPVNPQAGADVGLTTAANEPPPTSPTP